MYNYFLTTKHSQHKTIDENEAPIRFFFSPLKSSQHICFVDFTYRTCSRKGNNECVLYLITDDPFDTLVLLSSFKIVLVDISKPLVSFVCLVLLLQ